MGKMERKRWAAVSPEKKQKVHEARRQLVGEKAPGAKLTDADVRAIRRLADKGDLSVRKIGEQFGIATSTVSKIRLKKRWRHI